MCLVIGCWAVSLFGADKPVRSREDRFTGVGRWVPGPGVGHLAGVAEVRVPRGYSFLSGEQARRYLANGGYTVSGNEAGLVARAGTGWYAVFEYDACGHVTEEDQDTFDGEALLLAMRQTVQVNNWERRRRGWPLSRIGGWVGMPRYDPVGRRLEWALEGTWAGQAGIQYNTDFLGRKGVMRVSVIANPTRLSRIVPEYRRLLEGFRYLPGFGYADYRVGEPVARGGLTGLLVGPTAVVAVRSGVLVWPWTTILMVAGGLAGIRLLRALCRPAPPPPLVRPWYRR